MELISEVPVILEAPEEETYYQQKGRSGTRQKYKRIKDESPDTCNICFVLLTGANRKCSSRRRCTDCIRTRAADLTKLHRDAGQARIKPADCECYGEIMPKPNMDHEGVRESRRFRGWLCQGCNITLGHVRDSPIRLAKLSVYLRTHSTLTPESEFVAAGEMFGHPRPSMEFADACVGNSGNFVDISLPLSNVHEATLDDSDIEFMTNIITFAFAE
jgi:hypothetical protein